MDLLKFFRKKTRALAASQTHEGGGLTPMLYLEHWGNMTGRLTPSGLEGILQEADDGDITRQHLLFADMEDRCEHLAAEIGKRKRALLTLDWEILPGRAKNARAKAIACAVREQFDMLPTTADLLLDLADGIGHGFAALEIEWTQEDGLHIPSAFHHRPQSWFQVLREDRNTLRLRDGTVTGAELWPFGWIVHTHRSKSGWLPRIGLFRSIAWPYLIRSYALESAVMYTQIHGIPFRVGKYPPGCPEEDRAALRAALANLGRDASGIIPKEAEILFQTPANATQDVPGQLVTRCELGMSKAILGGTLTTQGDGKSSTNALGNVHNEVRHDLLVSDAAQIADTLTRQLLAPLAYLNCGVSDPALLPYFRFDTREPEDLNALADALVKLTPIMEISAKWAHEKTRIPRAESKDDILGDFTQKEEPDKETPLTAQATTVSGRATDPFPDQTVIDGLLDQPAVSAALTSAQEALVRPLLREIRHGADPAAILTRFGELYPHMNTTTLEDLLARAFFVADLVGTDAVSTENSANDAVFKEAE